MRKTLATKIILEYICGLSETAHTYGYDIQKVTQLAGGTVYPALDRLRVAGYVEAWRDPILFRRCYKATDKGREALASW